MTSLPSPSLPIWAVFGPGLAIGAAATAVAIPLVIHLLFRKRYQIIPWAAVRFLLAAERRHNRRIDRWLLLTLRMLALLLPLFAMVAATDWAEELWQWIKPGRQVIVNTTPRTHHVLVLDGSLSMTARSEDGRTRFEAALTKAETLIRSANAGDGFTLLYAADSVQTVVPGPATDGEKVVAELRTLHPSHLATQMSTVLPVIAEVLARSPRTYPRRQVTILSDLQRSTWASSLPGTDAAAPEGWQRILGRADVVVVDTARADVENLTVVDLSLADPLPMTDAPARVTVTVHNYGRTERHHVKVDLNLGRPSAGGESLAGVESQRIETLPAGGRVGVSFTLAGPTGFREAGEYVLQARLAESDDLPADDVRTLVVEVRDGLTALLVDGRSDPDPARRGAWYLSEALFPTGAKPSETPARPRTITPAELADPAVGDLTATDCVFLCDVPTLSVATVARLEAHLKRGGGVVIGLGPNAAANADLYNRLLYADGTGILPGPVGEVVRSNPNEPGYRFAGTDEAFRRPPLAAFRDDNARAALVSVPVSAYLRLEAPPDGRAKRLLSFVPAPGQPSVAGRKPDPAIVEWQRHRGRVIVSTSSFNQDWTTWPLSPTYLPFMQELLRFAATSPNRYTVRVGEALEEYLPAAAAGLTATMTTPDGIRVSLPITVQDEVALVRFTDTPVSGLYRLAVPGMRQRVFGVNVAEGLAAGGSESDLRRIDPGDLRPVGAIRVVADPADAQAGSDPSGSYIVTTRKPHGPMISRFAVMAALAVLALEILLAWRLGPARNRSGNAIRPPSGRYSWTLLANIASLIPLLVAVTLVVAVTDAERTGRVLDSLPEWWRHGLESTLGIPPAAPGEGTRWRLEGFTAFVRNATNDRRLLLGLVTGLVGLTVVVYRLERRAFGRVRPLVMPALLRTATFATLCLVLLPQIRLAFDREGWPEIVILVDTSGSMATIDDIQDPAVRARAEELLRTAGLTEANRLDLAKLLLQHPGGDWFDRLLGDKQVRVYVYAVDAQARVVADLTGPADAANGRKALDRLKPDGVSSHLGDGVEGVLKAFRGGSLTAVVMFTDGVTTAGDDVPKAAREAARAGVPLYLIGMGDARESTDLALTDLQVEDVVTRGDPVAFQAQLTAHGPIPASPLPVILYEKQGEKLVERTRTTVTPDPTGNPVSVRMTYRPDEVGEKVYVLETPGLPGEPDTSNNRIVRTVLVTEGRRARVLYVEGRARYEFRFVKALLERESERAGGSRSVELSTLLLDASNDWKATDKTALSGFPTASDLTGYDVVILGDFDPKQLPGGNRSLQELADFVRIRGGGLLVIAGEHSTPAAFADTPLADILPVVAVENTDPKRTAEDRPIADGYRPKLTPAGQGHPLFPVRPGRVRVGTDPGTIAEAPLGGRGLSAETDRRGVGRAPG